ncbi:MAG: hypothetical protein OEZ39_18430 [Gammaproteobacteria bacterium]|nr:hypothetical protein [Gammaproteobacteria bacterium]MDH5653845.1 hypothetical protein [Gammaproteobacteria bacterium]
MKNTILLLIFFGFVTLTGQACADNACKYGKEFVKERDIKAKDISHQYWRYNLDPDSGEHFKTLHLFYTNGDQAVIEHKYCSMYNFELVYFLGKSSNPSLDQIGSIVGDHVNKYSSMLNQSAEKISNRVKSTLSAHKFSSNSAFSRGFDGNLPGTELSISFMPFDNIGSMYSGIIGFYLGVGGE